MITVRELYRLFAVCSRVLAGENQTNKLRSTSVCDIFLNVTLSVKINRTILKNVLCKTGRRHMTNQLGISVYLLINVKIFIATPRPSDVIPFNHHI